MRSPEWLRNKAEEARAKAQEMAVPTAMRLVAEHYEYLARIAEREGSVPAASKLRGHWPLGHALRTPWTGAERRASAGDGMAYRIDYFKHNRLAWSDVQGLGTLVEAQSMAEHAVAARLAELVEIRDEQGALVFQCPRIMPRCKTRSEPLGRCHANS
jgi:hypothetical protein